MLARALVAAPWDDAGAWLMILLGTASLLGMVALLLPQTRGDGHATTVVSTPATMAVIGLGLAPLSPLGALGAVALMVAGVLLLPLLIDRGIRYARAITLLATFPGVWLISQAALPLEYGIVTALLLPTVMLALFAGKPEQRGTARAIGLAAGALACLAAFYPQGVAWLALRPAVGAMAGGVDAPASLAVDWGLGLRVEEVDGVLQAALPVTGIAAALFVAWAALYWLRRLVGLFAGRDERGRTGG
jgi:hypothetical protein